MAEEEVKVNFSSFEQVAPTSDWIREIERSGGVPHFVKSRELGAYFDAYSAVFRTVLPDLGLAKSL